MPGLRKVANHINYIRSNWTILFSGFVLTLMSVVAIGSVSTAGGDAQAYYYGNSGYDNSYYNYYNDYARYSDNYNNYLNAYNQYSRNYNKYLNSYNNYLGAYNQYSHNYDKYLHSYDNYSHNYANYANTYSNYYKYYYNGYYHHSPCKHGCGSYSNYYDKKHFPHYRDGYYYHDKRGNKRDHGRCSHRIDDGGYRIRYCDYDNDNDRSYRYSNDYKYYYNGYYHKNKCYDDCGQYTNYKTKKYDHYDNGWYYKNEPSYHYASTSNKHVNKVKHAKAHKTNKEAHPQSTTPVVRMASVKTAQAYTGEAPYYSSETPEALPQAGPSDDIKNTITGGIIGFGSLVGAGAYYLRSRRDLADVLSNRR